MTTTAYDTRPPRDPMQDTAATVTALHHELLLLKDEMRRLRRRVSDLEGRESV